jgi:hypothetical protein
MSCSVRGPTVFIRRESDNDIEGKFAPVWDEV